jgi:hypothetical protein
VTVFSRRCIAKRFAVIATVIILVATSKFTFAGVEEFVPPDRIRMLPVVLVASDQKPPTSTQKRVWMRHLQLTQQFYKDRLSPSGTFEFAKDESDVIKLKRPLSFYRSLDKGESALHWADELLDHYKVSRFQCPYTFCCLVMNPRDRWPVGGGRTLNGGINRGGGLMVMSSFAFDRMPNGQSTLRHEIAHTCGLPHVDNYGYDMTTSHSVMAYNTRHRTKGFRDSATPPELIPDDLRAISLASRVFPKFRFVAKRDLPSGYEMFRRVVTLGPMKIPDHPDYDPAFTTPSGEVNGSKVTNLNEREILPSVGPGVTYQQRFMWASGEQANGQVVLDLDFPGEVSLTRLLIHSGHSGKYNRAEGVRVETLDGNRHQVVTEKPLATADAEVEFDAATSRKWRLTFTAGSSKKVCLRGLQYFYKDQPLFPPPVPYNWRERIGVNVPAFAPAKK